MPNTREKLIKLLYDIQRCGGDYTDYEIYGMRVPGTVSNEDVADHLIANGVTVQEWISVKDRLPEESGMYITFGCTAVPVRWLHNFDKDIKKFGAWWNYEPDGKEHPRYRFIEADNITHWMPLPQPPMGNKPYHQLDECSPQTE